MIKKIDKYSRNIVVFLGSTKFLWVVLSLFVLQAAWIALSFRYPLIYDEVRHVPIIEIYANGFPPFSANQPTQYDQYGSLNLATGGYTASFYHYIMSFPYRLIDVIGASFPEKVIILRGINIMFFAAGIYLYARLFTYLGFRRAYTNLCLFLFIMLPITPFVAAHVNYDNMLFLLSGAYFLVSIKVIRSRTQVWARLGWLLALGMLASLIKYTFLPVFAASVVFIVIWLFRKYGVSLIQDLMKTPSQMGPSRFILWVSSIIVLASLFSYIYIGNIIRYHTPKPECEKVLSVKRCQSSPIAKRNIVAQSTASTRPLMDFPSYVSTWYNNMVQFTIWTTSATVPSANVGLPVMKNIVFFGVFVALGLILYSWAALGIGIEIKFLLSVSAALLILVFIDNYSSYKTFHAVYATQPRYLLTVVPIIIILAIKSLAVILRRYPTIVKVGLVISVLAIFTQGGGAITHIVRSDPSWYWDNPTVQSANRLAKSILSPLVKE